MSPAEAPVKLSSRGERTREALVRAGRRLFAVHAVDAVAIDDIVQAASVAKGSFYNHFSDKDALLRAIIAEIRAGIEIAVTRANHGVANPARRVARAVCVYLRHALDDPERAGVLARMNAGSASLETPMNRGLIEDISAGLAAGTFAVATVEVGVLYVFGLSQVSLARVAETPELGATVALAQQICALLLRGLSVPAAEADLIAAQSADEIIRRGAAGVG